MVWEADSQMQKGGAYVEESFRYRNRVLVVDDHEDAAHAIAQLLRLHGYEAVPLVHAETVLAVAECRHPVAIVLDIDMPVLDGNEIARRVRATSWGRHILLIALSGWDAIEDIEEAERAGFDHFISKPLTHVDLLLGTLARHSAQRLADPT